MELKNLQEIFNNRLFRIPDYQRGYSWEAKQLDDLWRDVSILEDKKIHYTGLLSVDPQNDAGIIHVVDGQQRLISLIILIHVICNCEQLGNKEWVNGNEKVDYIKRYLYRNTGNQGEVVETIFGYEKDNPSHIHFKTKILGLPDSESVPEHTLYTNNLDSAKKFFENKIRSLEAAEIETVLKKITEQLQFLYYPLDSGINKFVIFETLNYRGKNLSKLELLKNRLMYLSTELPENDEQEKKGLRNDINNAWKTVYEYLGKIPEKPLNDDNFLMAHWIMYFDKYDRSASNVFAKFLLDEHFTADRVSNRDIKHNDILAYVLDIQKVVQSWYYLHNPKKSNYSHEIKAWLEKLNRLNFRSFRPLIASILANEVEESRVLQTLKYAEQFNFVVLEVKMGNNNSNYQAVPIYRRTYNAHHSPDKFEPEKFSLNGLEVPESTFAFKKEKFSEKIWNDHYANGFYEWGQLKYFLYEYELHLQQKSGNKETKLNWEQPVNTETIEHIYPQNPNCGSWQNFKSNGAEKYLHQLGNLILFPRVKNSKLGNRSFEEKREEYKTGSYSAIDVSKNKDWGPETIEERQEKMLDFLWKRWNLKESRTDT